MPRRKHLDNRASITLALGLETARKTARLTALELASRAGCTPQHIAGIEDRRTNPAQQLIANLARELRKSPAGLYMVGELRLDEQTAEAARRMRQRAESEHDLESILRILKRLDRRQLQTVIHAAMSMSKS